MTPTNISTVSRRDYFAAKAMQGMLVGCVGTIGNSQEVSAYAKGHCNSAVVDRAYAIADAMLAASGEPSTADAERPKERERLIGELVASVKKWEGSCDYYDGVEAAAAGARLAAFDAANGGREG